MHNFDFAAHAALSNSTTDIQGAIQKANEKASMGIFVVCVTSAGDVLVLPEFSASVRDDIAEVVYKTDSGYAFSNNK